jgi:signal transduction histidine kinase
MIILSIKDNFYLKSLAVITFLVLISLNLFPQNTLEINIKKQIDLSQQAYENDDTTNALKYATKALELSNPQDEYAIAISQLQLAKVDFIRKKYADSYQNYWKSYSYFKRNNNIDYSIEALYGMGVLFEKFEVWTKALSYLQNANELLSYTTKTTFRIPIKQSIAHCYYQDGDYSNALFFYEELRKFSIQYKDIETEIMATEGMALCHSAINDYKNAISIELSLIDKYSRIKDEKSQIYSYYQIGLWYQALKDYDQANTFYSLSQNKLTNNDSLFLVIDYRKAQLATSLLDFEKSSRILERLIKNKDLKKYETWHTKALNLWVLNAYYKKDYKTAIERSKQLNNSLNNISDYELKIMALQTLAITYENSDSLKKAIYYYKQLNKVRISEKYNFQNKKDTQFSIYKNLSKKESQYQISNLESKLSELEIDRLRIQSEKDQQKIRLLREQQQRRQLIQQNKILEKERENESLIARNTTLEAQKKQEEADRLIREAKLNKRINEAEVQRLQNENAITEEKNRRLAQNRIYLAALVLIGLITFFVLLKAYLKNKKLTQVLEEQNAQLENRRKQTEAALQKVKETQSQLIESERLASLGQLTAGIAHEIRNPLNFVNNFSSLITELLDELEEVIEELNIPEGKDKDELIEILKLIEGNNSKVNKHGVRASKIISRMLDASRGGATVPEETDLNQLIMDSVKLSYQGIRGELASFNLDIQFDLDESIGNVKVIHQDLGRVIINITNNACHAMEDKLVQDDKYLPVLKVKTINNGKSFSIIIEDNGKGMSKELQSKIFNPFFTTKPAGKGTGLGLTMTYDIITKMHNGSINIESREGEFSRFIIEIPKV